MASYQLEYVHDDDLSDDRGRNVVSPEVDDSDLAEYPRLAANLENDLQDPFEDGEPRSNKSLLLNSDLAYVSFSEAGGAHRHFPEWDSLPDKYLTSTPKSYLAFFKVRPIHRSGRLSCVDT